MKVPLRSLASRLERVYAPPVRTIFQVLGVESHLIKRYLDWLSPQSVTVAGTCASFCLRTTGDLAYVREVPERDVIRDVLAEIRSDDVFFDIGANVGMYACFVGQRLTEGRVVAFEPTPAAMSRLRHNLKLNEIDPASCLDVALSDSAGSAEFVLRGSRGSESGAVTDSGTDGNISVQTVIGDRLVAGGEVPQPSVLKIDVEGGEMGVLRGMRDTLSDPTLRLVYCEIHDDKGTDRGHTDTDVRSLLTGHDFEISHLVGPSHRPILKAKRSQAGSSDETI